MGGGGVFMSKRTKPADALPLSLPPRGLSRVVAAGYLGISTGLFDQMVADGRMPQPKVINSRKVWDRLAIDRHFDELGEADDGDNSWDDVSAGPIPDRKESHVTSRQVEHYNYPRTPEEWQEHLRLWRPEVIASPLLSRELMVPPGAKPREALRTLGLEKFAPPLLVSGHVDLDEADLSRTSLMYVGIPPKEAERIRFRQTPAYLLTIENYASFNRHIAEADPTRMGTTIYVGGYPSLGTQ